MWNVVRGAASAARALPDKVRTTGRLAVKSGLLRSLTPPGVAAMVRAMRGGQNPSMLYRVHARNSPDKIALIWRDRATTFAEMDARIDRLAAALVRRGIGRRQSVVSMVHNRQELVELGVAATRVGAATVSVSWRSTPHELAYLVNHSGARGIVLEPELMPTLEAARPELPKDLLVVVTGSARVGDAEALDELLAEPAGEPVAAVDTDDDAAVVIYTSGTTGKPKGAVRKFPKDTMFAAFRFINETPMRVDDVHLVASPLYHSTAFGFLSLSHILGSTAVVMDTFDPERFLALVERHRVTTTAVVPTMLHRVLELPASTRRRYDASSLRAVFCGGAPLAGPLATEFMDAFGDVLFNFYGATETGLVTLAQPADLRAAPGTIGRLVPGNTVRLLDDARREVPAGAVGELFVRNKLLVAGYHADEEATRASMVEGFFSVGDLARCERGLYFLEGRKRDMIISGGVNVYPAEVETALEEHPGVGEVAVVGKPDREWGERVVAYVAPKAGATLDPAEVTAFARARLAGPKVPREVVVLDALPRNPTGKVLKRELRGRD